MGLILRSRKQKSGRGQVCASFGHNLIMFAVSYEITQGQVREIIPFIIYVDVCHHKTVTKVS